MEENDTDFLYAHPKSGLLSTKDELFESLKQLLLNHASIELTEEEAETIAASRVQHWEHRVFREQIDVGIKLIRTELQKLRRQQTSA